MSFTIVSAFWPVKNKYGCEEYFDWMKKSLRINCPYVFFSSKEVIEKIKEIRNDLPTYYIELNLEDLYCYRYKNNLLSCTPHVPSSLVNVIWNEKVFLLEKAFKVNPFNSDFFMWIDAGIYFYRNEYPPTTIFPNINKIKTLPKDKFIFSSSDSNVFEEYKVHDNHYYHYISGGCFIIHKNIIQDFISLYKSYIDKYLSQYNWVNTEQKILTHILAEHPELFYKLCHGYGEIVKQLI